MLIFGLWALVRKEVDAVRPYWGAVLVALGFQALDLLIAPQAGWTQSRVLGEGLEGLPILGGMLAFSLAHTLVASEYTEGHIEFLEGLPVRRWQVYFAKLVAVVAPLLCLAVGASLNLWLACHLHGAPFASDPTGAVVEYALRLTATLLAFAGMGLLGSWAGGLAWGALMVGFFTLAVLTLAQPALRPFLPDPFGSLFTIEWVDGRPVRLWAPVVFWTAVGGSTAFTSGLLFLGPGRWLVAVGSWSAGLVRAGFLGCGGGMFLLCAGLLSFDLVAKGYTRLLQSTTRVQTEHFRFLYATDEETAALALIAESEDLNRRLAQRIGNPEPLFLDIELLSGARGHAGVFVGGKIRMSVDDAARDTLVHELAHAHAFALSGWQVMHQYEHIRFFEEGLARHYAQTFAAEPPDYRWAALVYATDQARFDLLVEDQLRGETYDADQAYPLGEQFVRAALAEHGEGAVACLLREIGAIDDPHIAGLSLWATATRRCGHDLDRIVARYRVYLQEEADKLPKPLPQLSARPIVRDRVLSVTLDDTWPNTRYLCRFRDDTETPRNQWETRYIVDDACAIPSEALSGGSFEYQLGYRPDGADWIFFHKWTVAEL